MVTQGCDSQPGYSSLNQTSHLGSNKANTTGVYIAFRKACGVPGKLEDVMKWDATSTSVFFEIKLNPVDMIDLTVHEWQTFW